MKKTITLSALALSFALAAPAHAATFTIDIDLDDIESFGELGDPGNTILSQLLAPNATVTGLGYEVDLTAFDPSYLSEIAVYFLDSPIGLQLTPAVGEAFPGSGSYSSGGIINLGDIDPTFPFSVGADGILDLEFFELFDDGSVSPDGLWNGTLTIQYEADAIPGIPEPTTWAMMIGGFGVVGGALRSRRKTTVAFSA